MNEGVKKEDSNSSSRLIGRMNRLLSATRSSQSDSGREIMGKASGAVGLGVPLHDAIDVDSFVSGW